MNRVRVANGHFYNPTCGELGLDRVVEELINYMQEKPHRAYDVIVGCDSSSDESPVFPVAVVILRRGEGGRFFLRKVHFSKSENRKFKNWKMRILEEVMLSCELALVIKEKLENRIIHLREPGYEFRYIHADIGENGATKDMIREVTGLIRGNGFEPKIKPEAYAASGVADKYC